MAHIYKDLFIALAEGKDIEYSYIDTEFWDDLVSGDNSTAKNQFVSGVPAEGYEIKFRVKQEEV